MMKTAGFTLIELVMVLVLIGILAVFVAPKLGDVTSSNAGAFTDKLRADIRYAQNLAMTRNLRSRAYFNGTGTAPPSGYAIVSSFTSTCTSFVAATDPALSSSLTITLGTGSYANISVAPGTKCLEYDSLGRPYDCIGNLTICSSVLSGMTVTIKAGAAAAGSVTISQETGAVN